MKVKYTRLIDARGREVAISSRLTLGRVYHVMGIIISASGERTFLLISEEREGEFPIMTGHKAECFEVVSESIPSNWRPWMRNNTIGITPLAWQADDFSDAFYDHAPETLPIFERERAIILREDP
jgi:hypothetical protein